jgi:DNA-directed RNA polymerase specialized sigma24 family protein
MQTNHVISKARSRVGPGRDLEAVTLAAVYELPRAEITRMLNRSPADARQLIKRGRDRLRRQIELDEARHT